MNKEQLIQIVIRCIKDIKDIGYDDFHGKSFIDDLELDSVEIVELIALFLKKKSFMAYFCRSWKKS